MRTLHDDDEYESDFDDSADDGMPALVDSVEEEEPHWMKRLKILGFANMLQAKVLSLKSTNRKLICLDGGATVHIANDARTCFDAGPSNMEVMGVLGKPAPCSGKGSLHLQPHGNLSKLILTGAHITKDFPFSFINESMHEKGLHNYQEGSVSTCFGCRGERFIPCFPQG